MDAEQPSPPPEHYQIRVSNQYARPNPNGGKPLEFWRTIALTFRYGTPAADVDARAREAAYAAELSAAVVDAQVAAGPSRLSTTLLPATTPPFDVPFDVPFDTPGVPSGERPPPPGGAAGPARAAPPLTDKQLKAIYAIGRNVAHLSEEEIDARCQAQFGCRPSALSRTDASQLIDELQGKSG